jgi:hypothetical protein
MRRTDESVFGRPLPNGAATLAVHDGAGDARDHPARPVLDVAGPQGQDLAWAHGGAEQDLDDVADLTIGLGPGQPRTGAPDRGGDPDRRDLLQGQGLRRSLGQPTASRR